MTAVLLVGAGAVGARAARQLSDTAGVDRLQLTDRRLAAAQRLAHVIGPRAEAVAWDPGVAVPEDVRAIACTVPAGTAVDVARAACDAGIGYASCADDVATVGGLLDLDATAQDRGVTVAVGCGLAPGLADVLARHAGGALDVVDEVNVARAGIAGDACRASWRHALHERAVELRDHELHELRRHGGHDLVWFPDPVGAQACELVAPGVRLLAAALPEAERITVRYGGRPDKRGLWPHRRDLEGSWGALRVEVWGRRGIAREPIVYGAIERTAIAAGTVLAVSAASLAGALTGPLRARPGAHGLGELADPVAFLAELARRGVKVAAFEGVAVA